MNGYRLIAVIITALAIVVLPKEFLSTLWEECVQNLAMLNSIIVIAGWGFFTNKLSSINFRNKIVMFIVTNRILSVVSLGVDGMMIYVGSKYGFEAMFFSGQIVFFLICVVVLKLYDLFLNAGLDLLSINDFLELRYQKLGKRQYFKRITQWILRREETIFWLGSIWIEPDIVTLLLKKNGRTKMKDIIFITLPSTMICISFWAVIFGLGLRGFAYFSWFIE